MLVSGEVTTDHRLTGKREVAAWCACSEGGKRGQVEVATQHDIYAIQNSF
jgi:hypothetical protein